MKTYLINLSSRPDRLESATVELAKINISPERFEAITEHQAGGNRPLAFNKSQYYCLEKAVRDEEEIFAVFEDDAAFTEGAQEQIQKALSELPEHFGILHLGCNIIGMSTTEWEMPDKYSEHLAQLYNAWQTHAIIWSRHAAKFVLGNFPFHGDEYTKEGLMIFDEWLRQNMYPNLDCFVMRPMVAYQKPDFSDLNQAHSDYTSCFHLGNQYLNSL